MNKRDIILISSISIIIIAVLVIFLSVKNKGDIARVYLNNEEILEINLKENNTYIVNGNISEVKIEVKDNKIAITESGCSDHTCIRFGYIDDSSKTIICAPNGIFIKVDSTKDVDISIWES